MMDDMKLSEAGKLVQEAVGNPNVSISICYWPRHLEGVEFSVWDGKNLYESKVSMAAAVQACLRAHSKDRDATAEDADYVNDVENVAEFLAKQPF